MTTNLNPDSYAVVTRSAKGARKLHLGHDLARPGMRYVVLDCSGRAVAAENTDADDPFVAVDECSSCRRRFGDVRRAARVAAEFAAGQHKVADR